MELEVEGIRSVGRQKKTWSKLKKEDKRKLNITENISQRIENSEGNSHHVHPQEWETREDKR